MKMSHWAANPAASQVQIAYSNILVIWTEPLWSFLLRDEQWLIFNRVFWWARALLHTFLSAQKSMDLLLRLKKLK
jgi:hypothetical protein